MGTIKSETSRKKRMNRACCLFAAAWLLLSLCAPAAAESFLPVMPSDTLDYYTGYGEPELSAALRGSNEFGKGESATIQISIANHGLIEKLVHKESIVGVVKLEPITVRVQTGDDNGTPILEEQTVLKYADFQEYASTLTAMNTQMSLAAMEMQLESGRVNAEALNVKFECDSPYIDVETGGDYVFIESLLSGYYDVAAVPVRISPNAPAGEYLINMTIDYRFPFNTKMIRAGASDNGGLTTFLYSDAYIQEYEPRQVVMQIPIYVSSGAVFEATEINGTISAGKTRTVAVTYTNVGDETAYNAECKLALMHPLSSSRNKGFMGDVAPGESVTIEYPVTSHGSAIAKVYGVNSDIRYYDADDKLQIAPSLKLDFEMINPFTIFTFRNALIGVLLLVIVSLGYDYYKSSKKKRKNN